MKPKSRTKNSYSLWKWNTNDSKKKNGIQFPVPEFLHDNYSKFEETIMGPGGGVGIGCGIGAGIGWVGGAGYGGRPWNHTKLIENNLQQRVTNSKGSRHRMEFVGMTIQHDY
ncbi:hypothetical protein SADUNF_Sadunf04G0067500 [Salix dunnii]|uniref:Glycine-rich protein n=1 Tax=Salix dunnii TaxID=1413687 RepID=A0A835KB10_9ROSI|nr:hypothetical protein SADUNF_Sadunf04G0067500 [Salix dunnii]